MEHKNEKRIIAWLLCISIFLLTIGLYTAFSSISFANPSNGPVKYDVYFSEVGTNKELDNRAIVNNNRIDLGMTFTEYGQELHAVTNINNDSDVDTKLAELNMTKIEDVVVGKSDITGIEYKLSDFISFRIYYEQDSEVNDLKTPNSVTVGDMLRRGTTGNVAIKVALKEEYQLTKDQKHVFEQLNKELNVNLYIEAIYLEA